ncbi:unnamed protein product [Ranitomeya imitator]|uniref:Chromo domain-containing protein n=1 Tax=Ranitomeya imitator TaxID=111125 RepID=A0ABN9LRX6_9NEOB|nr:unnamed protein product [Ranitomeya imitator]
MTSWLLAVTVIPCGPVGDRRRLQYLVKWKGYGQEDNSWVVASDVDATDLVRAFHLARPDRPGGSDCGHIRSVLSMFVQRYQYELILYCWKLWEADLPSTPLVRCLQMSRTVFGHS